MSTNVNNIKHIKHISTYINILSTYYQHIINIYQHISTIYQSYINHISTYIKHTNHTNHITHITHIHHVLIFHPFPILSTFSRRQVPESWRILLAARAVELELEAELEPLEALALPPAVEDEEATEVVDVIDIAMMLWNMEIYRFYR